MSNASVVVDQGLDGAMRLDAVAEIDGSQRQVHVLVSGQKHVVDASVSTRYVLSCLHRYLNADQARDVDFGIREQHDTYDPRLSVVVRPCVLWLSYGVLPHVVAAQQLGALHWSNVRPVVGQPPPDHEWAGQASSGNNVGWGVPKRVTF